jgi:tetratricopeptide (TPR) repeat protein
VLLEALDVPAERLPRSDEAQLSLYRSLLAGKRMLIVLDNARDEAQVRPLLPGSLTCRVVVTSRNQLAGLVAIDAAHPLLLDVLSKPEAWHLLERRLGPDRLYDDAGATDQIIKASACLPLALAIVAARAALRPDLPLAAIAAELTVDRGLDPFAAGEAVADIRTVLSWSYRQLDGGTAHAFRLAGLHPGPALDAFAVAALTGLTLDAAALALSTLADGCLIQRSGPGRYGMHDLLRGYAVELSVARDAEPDRRAALTSLFDFYLHSARAATDVLYPAERFRLSAVPAAVSPVPAFGGPAQAQEWLDGQLPSLVAVTGYAARRGWPGHAIGISNALFRYLDISCRFAEAVTIHEHARQAAELAGDHAAEAASLISLGAVDFRQGRYQQAVGHYQQALLLYGELGDQAGQARARYNLSMTDLEQRRFKQASAHLVQALAYYRELGDRVLEGRALADLGMSELEQGRYRQAAAYLHESLALSRETGDRQVEVHVLARIALADFRLGLLQQAVDRWMETLSLFRETGDRNGEADVLRYLGSAELNRGRYEQARAYLDQTLAICRQSGYRHCEGHALGELGLVDLQQGEHRGAVDHLERSLTVAREIGDPGLEAKALSGLAQACLAGGEASQARDQYSAALERAGDAGDRYEQARAHSGLGTAYQGLGDLAQAAHHWRQAYAIYRDLGVPEAEEVRTRLGLAP